MYFQWVDYCLHSRSFFQLCSLKYNYFNIGDVGNLPPCKIDCVIYMITCSNCNIQYVGQTKKRLRYRVYGHKNSCKNKRE